MSSSLRRAALTGIGVVSPLGLDARSLGQSLRAGRSGVRAIRSFDASGFPVRIGGEIDQFDPRDYLEKKDRKQLKMMVRTIQLAVAGARLALVDGGAKSDTFDPARFGVAFGTGTIPGELADLAPAGLASLDESTGRIDLKRWGQEGMSSIPPMWMLNHVPNMPACHVSIVNNAQGPNNTITQSDAASLLALGEAYRIIQRDSADVMLAGGADTRINPISLIRFSLFSRLSRRNEEPEKASRPFDRQRDGQVLAEGAGVVLLEDLDHARRRGATVYAEVVGFGSAFDRGRTGRGLARAIHAALTEAGISPVELDHVNAHAAGNQEDAWEARGLLEALGEARTPVLPVKSYIGNAGAGASVIELAASLLALNDGIAPGALNQDYPDPECGALIIPREPRKVTKPYVLKVACTELGQCAAVVVRGGTWSCVAG
jgi:3-oxoacyl-[acyl-carrier-protein] synthase II